MTKRRKFAAEFKAKVALEARVGDKTLAELVAGDAASVAVLQVRLFLGW